jgi:hypothetical protein
LFLFRRELSLTASLFELITRFFGPFLLAHGFKCSECKELGVSGKSIVCSNLQPFTAC